MKKPSLTQLVTFVNLLESDGRATISETHESSVRFDGLSVEDAKDLVDLASSHMELTEISDSVEQVLDPMEFARGMAPYSVTLAKPDLGPGVTFLSDAAFSRWLENASSVGIVRVGASTVPFSSLGFNVDCWTPGTQSLVSQALGSPAKIVRAVGSSNTVPEDLRPHILESTSDLPWHDRIFQLWVYASSRALTISLATTYYAEADTVELLGPPRLTFGNLSRSDLPLLSADGFVLLHKLVEWIYVSERECELKHQLVVQELTRLSSDETSIAALLKRRAETALDGAKIAYNFDLQEVSKDSLKGLAELRKAVSEETQRITEATKQLSLGAAGAVFYGLGLIAAKITANVPVWVLNLMAIVGFLYVCVVLYINYAFMREQKSLRDVWRRKLYRYLTDTEYHDMVINPTARSERLLWGIMIATLSLALLTFGCVLVIAPSQFVPQT